jgi:phenylacetate-CoA ligase
MQKVNLPSKIIKFGAVAFDVSDRRNDDEPYSKEYNQLCYEFVRHTVEACEFYRERVRRAGLSPLELRTPEGFAAIPPLSSGEVSALDDSSLLPDDLRERLKVGFHDLPQEQKLWRKFTTSGSSGLKPKVSYYTKEDWEVLVATGARLLASHVPFGSVTRVLNCFNGGHVGAKFQEDSISTYGCSVEGVHISRTTPEAVLEQLMRGGAREFGGFNGLAIPPGIPSGSPGASKGTNLDALLNIDADNYIGKNIRVIITSGSPRDAAGLNLKERVWEANELAGVQKTKFFEMYGFSESLPNAIDCELNEGLHLGAGPTYTEVLDEKTGKHVQNGERGFVVVTGIRNGSRFIRYAVGDEATYVSEPCRCGRKSPRLLSIQRVIELERLQQGCGGGV